MLSCVETLDLDQALGQVLSEPKWVSEKNPNYVSVCYEGMKHYYTYK